jgi:RNA polymerase sigma-70 factor, ECF subfamily
MQQQLSIAWNDLHSELIAFVYPKVKDKAAAEDIVQDVFIKVHTKSHQLKEVDKTSGWIYQITRHAITDHFRKNSKVIEFNNLDVSSGDHYLNDCVANCLQVLMKTLPEKYRVALELTDLENLPQFELAERLNISYPGARSRVQRARKMLKDKIEAMYLITTDSYGNITACDNHPSCCKKN